MPHNQLFERVLNLHELDDVNQAVSLLHQYGYLKQTSNVEQNPIPYNPYPLGILQTDQSGMTIKPRELIQGLRAFQKRFNLPVTGNLDVETQQLLVSSRCGNPDQADDTKPGLERFDRVLKRIKRYLIGDDKMKWTKKKLTWQIQSYPSKNLSRSRTHAVFQHAFNLWSKIVDLDFVEEKDYYKPADIIIRFGSGKHGDSIPFDGIGGVLAHAYYPTPDNVYSFSGDAHFDDDENWNDGPHEVATHELGHSLGLGHSAVSTAIMYPYYMSTWDRIKLDEDDIAGIQKIYGAAKPGKFIPPEPSLPDIPPPPLITTVSPKEEKFFNYCNMSVDAIIKIRNLDLYVFKGEVYMKLCYFLSKI